MIDQQNWDADHAIARQLPAAWGPFFSRFGRLTEVQRLAIPSVLAGLDTVVTAPTASGKTEAVCAPLVERYRAHPSWMVLYVSPTRALVNDLFERLSPPLQNLGHQLSRRTGDHSQRPPVGTNILLTTPESFDSLLCRARTSDGHLLQRVTAVVLDEVHLLYGSSRGEQLKWLLTRLRRIVAGISGSPIQIVALSATVDDPQGVIATFAPGATYVNAGGGRQIQQVSVEGYGPTLEEQLPAYVKSLTRPEKLLVFCNSRRRVDTLATRLRPQLESCGFSVSAHHGSLSQKLREEAEDLAKRARRLVLFASSTLEVGVDIGDIDLVVLDGPPPDISSLLQRLGRGNRRTGYTRVMTCARSLIEVLLQSSMVSAAESGYLGIKERGPQLAVARQQIASYIFQRLNGQRTRQQLQDFCSETAPAMNAGVLIQHLLGTGELLQCAEGLRLGEFWQEQSGSGGIHSNIESTRGQTVVDDTHGHEIASGVRFREGSGMEIGGRLLRVKDFNNYKILVKDLVKPEGPEGKWNYVVQPRLKGAGQPDALRQFLKIPETIWPIVNFGEVSVVFHFGGGRRRAVLELATRQLGAEIPDEIDEWALYFKSFRGRPSWVEALQASRIVAELPANLDRLERVLARPYANTKLPKSFRLDELAGWLAIEQELTVARAAEWSRPTDPDVRDTLEELIRELRT